MCKVIDESQGKADELYPSTSLGYLNTSKCRKSVLPQPTHIDEAISDALNFFNEMDLDSYQDEKFKALLSLPKIVQKTIIA